jgi:hypothetical protein
MKPKTVYAVVLAAILAAGLAPFLAVTTKAAPDTVLVPDVILVRPDFYDYQVIAHQTFWLNVTLQAPEDVRLIAVRYGIFYEAQPDDPVVVTVYLDGAMVYNGSSKDVDSDYRITFALPANATAKGGDQHTFSIKFKNCELVFSSWYGEGLTLDIQLLFLRNVTGTVAISGGKAKLNLKLAKILGSTAMSSGFTIGGLLASQNVHAVGVLESYVSDAGFVTTYQFPDYEGYNLVQLTVDSAFPTMDATLAVVLKPANPSDVTWKYDDAAGDDPASYARILEGTKIAVSFAEGGTLYVYDNGTQVGNPWTPKAGKHTVAANALVTVKVSNPVIYSALKIAVPGFLGIDTTMTVETLKVVTSYTAPEGYKPPFRLELAPGAVQAGVRNFNLLIKVPEGAVTVEKAEGVKFEGTVLTGMASTVKVTENLTTYQYLVNYTYTLTRTEGAGLLKAVWGIESTPTVSSSTPVLHYVTTGKPFVVEADRSIIRVLDSAGSDVAFAGGAVAASKSDTYTVKLVTYLKVTNTYEGKPVDALVTVRDAKTGLILYQRRGGEVAFELEPQVSYVIESTTDSETQTARTTLPQDTAISFTFTKPPAVSINWEMVQTIALIVAVIAIIALVIIIAKRGVSIEIG